MSLSCEQTRRNAKSLFLDICMELGVILDVTDFKCDSPLKFYIYNIYNRFLGKRPDDGL